MDVRRRGPLVAGATVAMLVSAAPATSAGVGGAALGVGVGGGRCTAAGTLYGFAFSTPSNPATQYEVQAHLQGTCVLPPSPVTRRTWGVTLDSVNEVQPGSPLYLGPSCHVQHAFPATLTVTDATTGATEYTESVAVDLTYPAPGGTTRFEMDGGLTATAGTIRNPSGCPTSSPSTTASASFLLEPVGGTPAVAGIP